MGSGLLAAIAGLAAPMTARVLMALGFSVVTFTGLSVAFASVKSSIISNVGGITGAMAQLMGLGGVWIAMGAVLGAMTFVVSLWGLTAGVKVMGLA